jgi:LacI family transcriptional regulator
MAKDARVKRPTSIDVARLAGVSQTTVSLVINDVQGVAITEETRARVWAAVAAIDYHPNEAARSLVRRATRGIALAIPDSGNPHYLELAAGIEAEAEQQDYTVFLALTHFDSRREQRCFQWLKQRRVDALILCDARIFSSPSDYDPHAAEVSALCARGYTITTLGGQAAMDSVMPEADVGERLLLEHLVQLGHRRIGYIYGVFSQEQCGQRLDACLRAQRGLGLPIDAAWIRRCGPSRAEAYAATAALVAECRGAARPTALIVENDLLATAVLAALAAAPLRVPAEMSVGSFDNTALAAYTVPSLTSVDPDPRALGQRAARLTIARLAAPQQPRVHLQVPVRLCARASTGPAPARQ